MGFIKGRSTEGLLTHPTEQWKIALCNGNVVGVVFIDFKKHLSVSQTQYKASNPALQWLCTEMDMRLSRGSETVYCCQWM